MANAVEFTMRIFPFNEKLQEELKKLAAEGWKDIPGLTPAISYVLWRNLQQPEQPLADVGIVPQHPEGLAPVAGTIRMAIDDSKIHIYRNGRIVEE